MQKKLLAVAVAGALGAPVAALAQTSTVQIYGVMYIEYSFADQGNGPAPGLLERSDVDFLQTPGSAIGFKGEEKLGGGLSAWFQCESTADPRGQSQNGWCSRNSALGLKGGFGNVFVGSWDTPFKRTMGPGLVGSNDTGIWGSSFLLSGGSTTTSFPGAAPSATGGTAARGIFRRRQNSSMNYDSPSFGGFRVMGAVTSAQPATGTLDGANNSKPRILSIGAQYSAGPVFVGAAWEQHKDANNAGAGNITVPPVAGTSRNGDDEGWHLTAAYTWGPVRFGGTYTRQKVETGTVATPTDVKYGAWHLGVDWRIVGPHGLRAGYTRARDTKGTPGAAGFGASGVFRPGVAAAGASNDNGAKLMQIRYVYTFSKRTEFNLGYVRLENDSVGTYNLGGLAAQNAAGTVYAPGNDQSAWALSVRHTF